MIRISEHLKVLLLPESIDALGPREPLAQAVKEAGGTIQGLLIETVGNAFAPMCIACMHVQETWGSRRGCTCICPKCGFIYYAYPIRNSLGMDWWYTWHCGESGDVRWQGCVGRTKAGLPRGSMPGGIDLRVRRDGAGGSKP